MEAQTQSHSQASTAQNSPTHAEADIQPEVPESSPASLGFHFKTGSAMRRKPLSPKDVLNLQRTVGNQAVMRVLEKQKTNKAPKHESKNQNPSFLAGVSKAEEVIGPQLQRVIKYDVKNLTKHQRAVNKADNSLYSKIIKLYKKYLDKTPTNDLENLQALATIQQKIDQWNKKDDKEKNGIKALTLYEFEQAVKNEVTSCFQPYAARLGLPLSYLNELLDKSLKGESSLGALINAHTFLEQGDVGKADKALVELKESIELGTFNLIKAALVRAHLTLVNPDAAKFIGNEDFEQKNEERAAKGETLYHTPTTPMPGYKDYRRKMKNINGIGNAQEAAKFTEEKDMFNAAAFKQLSARDKGSIRQYSELNFTDINGGLRGMSLGGTQKTNYPKVDKSNSLYKQGLQFGNKNAFIEERLGFAENTVSALNKLPPYHGKVYRHDNLFGGFTDIYRKGAIVSDMAFLSTTFRPTSLLKIFGEDILTIMTSKTGRFIKPLSASQHEDEVLFKPGTRFSIKEVYKATLNPDNKAYRGWKDLPADVQAVLNADPIGSLIKYIVIRNEV